MKGKRNKANDSSGQSAPVTGQNAHSDAPRVRDIKQSKFSWIPNEMFNEKYATQIGPYCLAVYCILAYHADNEKQTCFPSNSTIAEELDVSENKVREAARELEAWGMIHVIARYMGREQTSHLYTLVDPSLWRTTARYRNNRGKSVVKSLVVTTEDGTDAVGAGDTLGEPGGIPGAPGTVHQQNRGGVPGGYELDVANETHTDLDSRNLNECPPSLSLRDRALLGLLRYVAPDYRNPEKIVPGLPADRFDLVGATVLYYLAKPSKLKKLESPAAYFHYIMREPREGQNGIPDLPYDLDTFKRDWGRYLSLYQRVHAGDCSLDVERKFCCLLNYYGIAGPRARDVLQRYPCGDRDWDDVNDLDDELDDLDDDRADEADDWDGIIPF